MKSWSSLGRYITNVRGRSLSYMQLLDVPLGLLVNFFNDRVIDGVSRMVLRDANR